MSNRENEARTIYLAGGCFWGLEAFLKRLPGVIDTEAGYANGRTQRPTYEAVCHEQTGHAETVRVTYDARLLPLAELLAAFFAVVDPTSVNRQGNDRGEQYRSGIYYTDEEDLPAIRQAIAQQQAKHAAPVVTEVQPLRQFFPAEAYHQDYLAKNPGGYCHIDLTQAQAVAARLRPSLSRERYQRPDEERLRRQLTPLAYEVTQRGATERPYDNAYDRHFAPGIYVDVATGEPLFLSSDKFASGCGWPSFARPIAPEVVRYQGDASHGMERTEVRSRAGDCHLGHVFPDGPQELGGWRYCINSAALRFVPQERMQEEGYGDLLPLLAKIE